MASSHVIINGDLQKNLAVPGLILLAGQIGVNNGDLVRIEFPAKGVFLAMGTLGTSAVDMTTSVSNDLAQVSFTAGASGTVKYIILASKVVTTSTQDLSGGGGGGIDWRPLG